MDLTAVELGTRLVLARQAAGMTQRDVSRAVGIGQTAISRWEMGAAVPSALQLATLCVVLDADVATMLAPGARVA